MQDSKMDYLGSDMIELILSHLPIPSMVRASSVCKFWNSIIHSHSFKTRISDSDPFPWFFISGHCDILSNTNAAFAFDPESHKWIKFPNPEEESFTASNGLFFTINPEKFRFKPVFSNTWRQTAPLRFSTREHLIGVYNDPDCSNLSRFIVVGADSEGYLAVNIYNPRSDTWELCPPPPHMFIPGNSSNQLCSALFQEKFYLFGIRSCFISSFDLKRRSWSDARTLRPPGVLFSFLVSCKDQLVLAGLCRVNDEPEFNLWRIDERTFEFSEIGTMPVELRSCFFGNEGERKFTSLKCVGSGNVVYVFSEESERDRPACACEISSSFGNCRWTRIPDLPESVTCLREVISFSCSVSVQDVLGKSSHSSIV